MTPDSEKRPSEGARLALDALAYSALADDISALEVENFKGTVLIALDAYDALAAARPPSKGGRWVPDDQVELVILPPQQQPTDAEAENALEEIRNWYPSLEDSKPYQILRSRLARPAVEPESRAAPDRDGGVWINPDRCFGAPCVTGTRIPTEVLAGAHKAGDSIAFIAGNYDLTEQEVQRAIDFENHYTAPDRETVWKAWEALAYLAHWAAIGASSPAVSARLATEEARDAIAAALPKREET